MSKRKLWSHKEGSYGNTVVVCERWPKSPLYKRVFDPTLNGGKGGMVWKSLGHRNKQKAKDEAKRIAAELASDEASLSNPTVGDLFELYRYHELEAKSSGTVKWMRQNLAIWETFLGRGFRCKDIGYEEWEAIKKQRLSGGIDGRGEQVPPENRRPVSPGTVNLGLDAIRIVLNWATIWRVDGQRLLKHNPVRGLPYFKNPNKRRSVWTYDRFLKVLEAAETLTMQVEWDGKRERIPCYLPDVLAIAEGTGRRIGAVRQLHYSDVMLNDGPNGKVRWRADTDKSGKEWTTHITQEIRERLIKVIRDRPGLGDRPLFPAPRNAEKPVDRETLASWLRKAEQIAKVPRLPHDSFHGLRRKFVTERKHHPDADVAAAGGWRSLTTMKQAYQQADDAGILEVLSQPKRLRDRQG